VPNARNDCAGPGPIHHLRDAISVLVGRLELAYVAATNSAPDPEKVRRHLQRALQAEEKVLDALADVERAWRRQRGRTRG
jgi:hypothetical protein